VNFKIAERLVDAQQSENCVRILCTQLPSKYKGIAQGKEIYRCAEVLECDLDLRAGALREEVEEDLAEDAWAA
jgi:hypothetical protein